MGRVPCRAVALTVGVVDPLFHDDWADAVDDHDGVLVYACDLLDECVLQEVYVSTISSPGMGGECAPRCARR